MKIFRLFVAFTFICFGLSPAAHAVVPAPDGGYPAANTAEGQNALFSLTSGGYNTAVGFLSLSSNTTNSFNTALGAGALLANSADNNTAVGAAALLSNTTASGNTGIGSFALFSNTTASQNTALGYQALFSNTTGHNNTAIGYQALHSNTTDVGSYNAAIGDYALGASTTGNSNLAVGGAALPNTTTGFGNTGIGLSSLWSHTTGHWNIALGYAAGQNLTTGDNNLDLSAPGVAGESNIIRIGNVVPFTDVHGGMHSAHTATYVAGIANATVTGSPVYIDTTTGQLGLLSSSKRFKDGIEPMGNASEELFSLRPVTFHYKKNIDPKSAPQFGLVAEEVEKVNPDLVARDAEGKVFTVRYDAVNAMLLNEFLKARRQIDSQQKQIDALTAGLQKVSAQLEVSKVKPQVVENNR